MVPPRSGYSFTVSGSNWNLEKLFKIIESSTFAQGNLSRVFLLSSILHEKVCFYSVPRLRGEPKGCLGKNYT